MKNKLNEYIKKEPKLAGAFIGMSVRNAETGEMLYDYMGDTRLRPASNMKLLTATAALLVLGKDYTFATEILTEGLLKGERLQGNLYIKGKGDPTLLPCDFQEIAKQLYTLGIREISGDIIADDTWYDAVRLSPDMIWSDEQFYYGSQVSALTASPDEDYDAGSIIIGVSPGARIGDTPAINIYPNTDYIKIVSTAITGAHDLEADITIERSHGGNTILIKGMIPMKADPIKEYIAVWEPTGYALNLFKQALRDNGILWEGEADSGKTPESAEILLTHHSIPLSELLIPFMKLSNNGHGEILLKEMGKVVYGEGSWEKGLEVLEAVLSEYGMNTDTIFIRDGSGISHANLIPPNEISRLLYTIQQMVWFPMFLHALPVAGYCERMIGGTLSERLEGTTVQAKTGTIYSVSTLSGYVTTRQNKVLIFSIMINNLLDEEEGKGIEDNIVRLLIDD
ncbi:D-alanyl-D-alanine carboxypeptidase/D-alanyl-D-alanine-endopeptidase (penicillin-binding protein 4) [Virgibacillus halotolerans]|uniref:D-alanyl-D-alanine carboxypeptidase/D-alanyl-D-alanine endopeptidase n=1 Tax=Virgibacillus halotolerans TaxID=1071053 RepID=UPI00195FA54D|nr:D-alanyl-D-alanine carboxypeptidase/D-alanyl-D-alanine-endopeptidase [Virgibacillus halotolerans]MBM7598841.1 D-alanyl-D-alanine carboxypeptidase/D-alanyl-D-alanine-endopeptidase (penicillin-binding protein 4) [Virgibacillus halotolerans]